MGLKMKNGGPVESENISAEAPRADHYEQEQRFSARREDAPSARGSNPIPTWLSMSETVQVTPEIKAFVSETTETIATNYSEQLKNFTFTPCSNPKSVYIAKTQDAAGKTYLFVIAFAEMVGNEVPLGAPKSVALELAHKTLSQEIRGAEVAGVRVITKLDLAHNRGKIIDDMAKSILATMEGRGGTSTALDLSQGTSAFTVKSTDLNEVRAFFEERSPSAVVPAMNAGIVMSWAGEVVENEYGGRNDEYATNKPILAVSVMVDFVQSDSGNGRRYGDEGPTFTPNVRITGIDAIYPNQGLLFLGILFAIEKMVTQQGWMDAFYRAGNTVAGDPGNLFPDPAEPEERFLIVDPQEKDIFWRRYMNRFTDPIVTLDIEYGRRCIPFIYNFAAAAQGIHAAADRISEELSYFFGDRGAFADEMKASRTPIAIEFSSENTGVISQKDNHHIDSREVTLLSAMAGIVGVEPNGDVVDVLLNPNQVDAYVKDNVIEQWLGKGAFTSLYSTKSVILTGSFIEAAAQAARVARLAVRDADNRSSRILFSGRNNAADYAYNGSGMNMFSRNSVSRRQDDRWVNDAVDWTV